MNAANNINGFLESFVKAVVGKLDSIFSNWKFDEETNAKEQHPIYLTADLAPLVEAIAPISMANKAFKGILVEVSTDLKKLLQSKNNDDFLANLKKLFEVETLQQLPAVLKSSVEMNIDLALSFGISLKHFPNLDAKLYSNAVLEYFFNEEGYITVSGKSIQSPQLLSALELQTSAATQGLTVNEEIVALKKMVKDLKKQINSAWEQATAERYIRDMTRIGIEVTWNQVYSLKNRYATLKGNYGEDDKKKKLVSWFDSFANLAEASVLPAIETVLSGIGQVELNPKIVTAIGTFCSVTARKATEHAYLQTIGIPKPT